MQAHRVCSATLLRGYIPGCKAFQIQLNPLCVLHSILDNKQYYIPTVFRPEAPKSVNQNENPMASNPVPESSSNQQQKTFNDEIETLSKDNTESDDDTTEELLSDDEICAYEKLRMRNIAEREKLFRDLKISERKKVLASIFALSIFIHNGSAFTVHNFCINFIFHKFIIFSQASFKSWTI